MPNHGPVFAPGHDLGNGFLLGALGALLSSVLLIQHLLAADGEISSLRTAAVTASPFALAVAGCSAPLLIPHDTLAIALLGVGVGWLATIGILLLGLLHGGRSSVSGSSVPAALLAGACFAILLCATIALGDLHGAVTFIKSSNYVSYGVVALVFASAIPLFLVLSAIADMLFHSDSRIVKRAATDSAVSSVTKARIGRALVVIAGVGVLGRMLSNRIIYAGEPDGPPKSLPHPLQALVGSHTAFYVMLIGLFVGLLLWWICVDAQNSEQDEPASGSISNGLQNNTLCLFVALAAVMVAYQILAGLGIGLMILGAWSALGLALVRSLERFGAEGEEQGSAARASETAMRVVQLSALGAVLTLFRVYTTINEGILPRNPYTDQYAVFGFAAGVVVPLLLANYLFSKSPTSNSPHQSLVRLIVSGALLLVVPSLMLMLWGEKCVMAFLTALAITAGGIWAANTPGNAATVANGIYRLFATIYAMGMALALCEWSHYLLDVEDWTRIQKERVIVQVVGALIVLVVAADYRTYEWIVRLVKRNRTASVKGSTR